MSFHADYLRPYLNHSFQNVRERLGSILINIFEADLKFLNAPEPECPRIKDIMGEVVTKIQALQLDGPKSAAKGMNIDQHLFIYTEEVIIYLFFQHLDDADKENQGSLGEASNTEYDQAVRLFKTSK